jgi:3-oxoacyl-[acyl-carrier-protein] synthase II
VGGRRRPEVDPERLGVDFATGIGGLWTLLDAWDTLRERARVGCCR